jgi:hypothetical protein
MAFHHLQHKIRTVFYITIAMCALCELTWYSLWRPTYQIVLTQKTGCSVHHELYNQVRYKAFV